MRGLITFAGIGGVALSLLVACGSSPPRESDIYHDPALRAGSVQARGDAERALLDALASASDGPVEVAGLSAAATYHAASGRRCRQVTGADARLACEGPDGAWVFVPDVLSAEAR